MRAILTLAIILGLNTSYSAMADDRTSETQVQSAVASGHWQDGPVYGQDHWRRPGPGPRPGPPPPRRRSFLCDGTFWGGFSNGVRATMTLQQTGWNRVNVFIGIDGGYNFSGQGTCEEYNGSAHIDFYVQGPGTNWGRGWGTVWYNGPGAVIQGNMENGLAFRFDR